MTHVITSSPVIMNRQGWLWSHIFSNFAGYHNYFHSLDDMANGQWHLASHLECWCWKPNNNMTGKSFLLLYGHLVTAGLFYIRAEKSTFVRKILSSAACTRDNWDRTPFWVTSLEAIQECLDTLFRLLKPTVFLSPVSRWPICGDLLHQGVTGPQGYQLVWGGPSACKWLRI